MPGRGNVPLFTEERARRYGWIAIALAVLVVYWPLSTFQYTINGGDTFDCWLPWRWFITLSLKNGHFPLWNPLQQMGYPVYADLQGPAWYPEAIALGGTVGHSIWTLQALFLGYLIVGGIGFMRLCNVVHADARIGTITGVAYALCGFFAAHQMHFYSVISAAWMPWLLAAQIKLMRAPHWRSTLEAAVIMMLLLTGGNHTFTIVAAYLLLALFMVQAIHHWRRGDRDLVRKAMVHELAFTLLTVLMACGTFYAWTEVAPYLGRMKGLPYEVCAGGSFTWQALPSFFFPGQMGNNDWRAGTDPTMANGYMGVLMLAFALSALFRRRTRVENTFAVFGIICGLIALSDELPFHRLAWAWLPGMKVFRFPSYFLYFTLLAVLLLAAGSLRPEARWRWEPRRAQLVVLGSILFLGTALVLLLPDRFPPAPVDAMRRSAFEYFRALGYRERLIAGWTMTSVLLIGIMFLTIRRRLTMAVVLASVFLEMGWNTHFALWTNAVSDLHPAALNARLMRLPQGPVIPDQRPLASHHDGGEALHHLWRNTQTFLGLPTHEGFNSFWPDHTYRLMNDDGPLLKAMEGQPFVYLSDHVFKENGPDHSPERAELENDAVLIPDEVPPDLHRSSGDQLRITGFNYDRIALSTSTQGSTFLLIQQSWFPGWTIRIDGAPAEVIRANVAAFGTVLPAGDHHVIIQFEKPLIPWLLGISMTTFFTALVLLSFGLSGWNKYCALGGTAGLAAMVAWSLFAHRGTYDEPAHLNGLLAYIDDAEKDRVVFTAGSGQPIALFPDHAFSPGFTMRADSLANGARSLILDFSYKRLGNIHGLIAVQRSIHGMTVDYDATPFVRPEDADSAWTRGFMVRDIRELRYPDEEVLVYIWNQGPDTMLLRDLRVRTSARAPWAE